MSDEKQSDLLRDEVLTLRAELEAAKEAKQRTEHEGDENVRVIALSAERDRLKAEIAAIQGAPVAAPVAEGEYIVPMGTIVAEDVVVDPAAPATAVVAPPAAAPVVPVAEVVPPAEAKPNGKPATDAPAGR